MLSAGTPLVGNGSFEGERLPGIPNWSGKGNFWRGRGECFVTDREAETIRRLAEEKYRPETVRGL